MHKSHIALGERWKQHFQASSFQNFMREHAPRPPQQLAPPALTCPPSYITLATALQCKTTLRNHLKGRVSFLFHISTHNGHITANYIHLIVIIIHICVDFTKHCGHRASRRMTQSKNSQLNLVSLQDAESIHCYHFRIQSFYSSLCFAFILWLKV